MTMNPQENTDYIFIGTASLFLPNKTIASGPLLVTKQGLSYANYHTTDPYAGTRRATNVEKAVQNVRESVQDLKDEYKDLKDLGEARKILKKIAATASGMEEMEANLNAWAAADPRLLRIPRDRIASIKTGFFAGLQVTLNDGTLYTFRCGKLKAIAAMCA